MIKLKTLREALEYSPEKIDSFVSKATKDLADTKKVFNALVNKIEDLSIASVKEDSAKAKDLLEKVKQTKAFSDKAYNTYYDIVDMYDYMDSPDNVKQLDRLTSDFDYLNMDIDNLQSALESILEAADYFKRFAKETES